MVSREPNQYALLGASGVLMSTVSNCATGSTYTRVAQYFYEGNVLFRVHTYLFVFLIIILTWKKLFQMDLMMLIN